MLMAGGGIKGGTRYGSSDEFGYKSIENRVSAHDIHATVLHALGIDFEQMLDTPIGRPMALSEGQVIGDLLATT